MFLCSKHFADKQLIYHRAHSNETFNGRDALQYNNIIEASWINLPHLLCMCYSSTYMTYDHLDNCTLGAVIKHGGINTVFEALATGTPMIGEH